MAEPDNGFPIIEEAWMLVEKTIASGMRIWSARPDTDAKRPLVLLLHERYGPVKHSFNMVEKLVQDGFVVCVPDMFHRYSGNRGAIEAGEARIDPEDHEALADLDETIAYLRTLPYVDGEHIGIAGFCMSGRTPLLFAAARPDTAAIAVFHGGVYPRDYEASFPGQESVANFIPRLPCPVLGVFGERDHLVPLENVLRFKRELEQHGKSYQIRVVADVPHAWLDSAKPDTYRPKKAEEAWATMVGFFDEIFAGKWDAARAIWRFESDLSIDHNFAGRKEVMG